MTVITLSYPQNNIHRSVYRNVCGLFCDSGPITLAAGLERRGYVPGDVMKIYAEANNLSGRSTGFTTLSLVQVGS